MVWHQIQPTSSHNAHESKRRDGKLFSSASMLSNLNDHIPMAENDKVERLLALLTEISAKTHNKTIIFAGTKHGVDYLTEGLWQAGSVQLFKFHSTSSEFIFGLCRFNVKCIHGDKNQSQRDGTLEEFKRSSTLILIATDVASRGLGLQMGLCLQ